ncbi:piggyBac transposable element-derived protein 4-like [Vespula maculifrons]|uniref:PiggyBac transposable element-derived protein 4-like n=1 Tax=Vespula maculifrons TaxID=7453 RepID=A0ABD2CFG4_VESMC
MKRDELGMHKMYLQILQLFFNILNIARINAKVLYKEITEEKISRREFYSTCQVRYCKNYKITKICLRCKKYMCGKCTFKNKIICKKCNVCDFTLERFSTVLNKSNNCTLTIYKSKPSKKVTILSSMHKSINCCSSIRLKQNWSMSLIRWQKKSSQNHIDSMCKFFSISLIWLISMHGYFIKKPMNKIYPNNILPKAITNFSKKKKTYLVHQVANIIFHIREKHARYYFAKKKNQITKYCIICKKYICGKCMKENPIICQKCN